jgi:hypothetical protein
LERKDVEERVLKKRFRKRKGLEGVFGKKKYFGKN